MRKLIVIVGKIVAALLLLVVVLIPLVLYMGNAGIPFVEGTWETKQGSAKGFDIGMSKDEAFAILETSYSSPDHFVEVHWKKGADVDATLEDFENTPFANSRGRRLGTYRIAISNLQEQTLPLRVVDSWTIKLPASWVNSVHLEFEGNTLRLITEDRWIMERT